MRLLLLCTMVSFSSMLLAQTKIEFSSGLGDQHLHSAIDRVLEEAKAGQADLAITYSGSMGRQSLWVTVTFLQDSKADDFVTFYRDNNMKFFIIKNGSALIFQ